MPRRTFAHIAVLLSFALAVVVAGVVSAPRPALPGASGPLSVTTRSVTGQPLTGSPERIALLNQMDAVARGNATPDNPYAWMQPLVPGQALGLVDRIANPDRTAGRKGAQADRWSWFDRQRAYPTGVIPTQIQRTALNQTLNQRNLPQLSFLNWSNLGPAPITEAIVTNTPIRTAVSGRANVIAVHPTNTNIVFGGAANGGIWKSTNGGSTWRAVADGAASLAIGTIAIAPSNPNIMYAGTGDQFRGGQYGSGILKSTDGGENWVRIAEEFFGRSVAEIAINPSNPDSLFAAVVRPSSQATTEPARVYRSTNGGVSWTALPNPPGTVAVGPQALHVNWSATPPVITAAWDTMGIFQSASEGAAWTPLLVPQDNTPPNRFGRVEFAVGRQFPNGNDAQAIIYAGVEFPQTGVGVLFKSVNNGATWSMINTLGVASYCGGQCWYDNHIAVHPTNPDRVMAGGQAINSWSGVYFRSLNGGVSWDTNNAALETQVVHPDLHHIAIAPSNPDIVWLSNDGGFHRSTNAWATTPTWTVQNAGLATLQFEGLAIHPTNPNILFGGLQDNAKARSDNGGSVWTGMDVGDGGFAHIDPFNPTFWYGTRFSETGSFIQLQRNDQSGSAPADDWEQRSTGIDFNDAVNFYVPFTVDRLTDGRLYLGTDRVYRSNNRADNWTVISPELTKTTGNTYAINYLNVAPSDPESLVVGTSDGNIVLSRNAGSSAGLATWTAIVTPNLPDRAVAWVGFHPTDANTIYAVFNGFEANTPATPGRVFVTRDSGATWTNISGGLPDVPSWSFGIDARTNTLFLGTDFGVFASSDGGASWQAQRQIPVVQARQVIVDNANNRVLVGTYGRSIWSAPLTAGTLVQGTYTPIIIRNAGPQ